MSFSNFTIILINFSAPCKHMFYIVLNCWAISLLNVLHSSKHNSSLAHMAFTYTCFYLNSAPEFKSTQSHVLRWGSGRDSLKMKQLEWELRKLKLSGLSFFLMWKFIDLSLIEQFILQTLWKWWYLHNITAQAICPFVSVGFSLNPELSISFYELLCEFSGFKTTGPVCNRNLRLIQKGLTGQSIYFHCF